ncbi:MAG: CAP domain-containing protein, partial [Chloroflexota bacterium]
PQPGLYAVELKAANELGSYSDFFEIEVLPEPVAYFSPAKTEIGVNQPLQFNHLGGGLGPLDYWWDFGDGSFSTRQNPIHTFRVAGRYLVQHKVSNHFGEDLRSVTVVVGDKPEITVDFPGRINAGSLWRASARNQIPTETEYRWQIGLEGADKATWQEFQGANVETSFSTPGRYIIHTGATSRYGSDRQMHVLLVDQVVIEAGEPQRFPTFTPESPANTLDSSPVFDEISLSPIEARSQGSVDLLFHYINQARQQAGVQPVRYDPALAAAAQIHTDDMDTHQFTGHTGSDGSSPLERAARGGFRNGGYAGETTAWGFDEPRDVVNFWLSSPGHKEILLNPYASQVGVAQTINFEAERVWYWTAEFAADQGSIESQIRANGMRLLTPAESSSFRFDETVVFNWAWPLSLGRGDRFVLYLENGRNRIERVGAVSIPLSNDKPFTYGLSIHTFDLADRAGSYDWFVRLIDSRGNVLAESGPRALRISGVLPSPTPTLLPTETPTSNGGR